MHANLQAAVLVCLVLLTAGCAVQAADSARSSRKLLGGTQADGPANVNLRFLNLWVHMHAVVFHRVISRVHHLLNVYTELVTCLPRKL